MTTQENTFKNGIIWKDVLDYEELYQVSNLGDVRGKDRFDSIGRKIKGMILKPQTSKKGYLQVSLCKSGKQKTYKIHRLVAEAFIPNSNNYPQVNHIDEDKTNNRDTNLEWCTNIYNSNWGTRNLRVANKNSHGVYAIDKNGVYTHYNSESEASRILNISVQSINAVVRKRHHRKSYKGYVFISDKIFDANNIYDYMRFEKGEKVTIKNKTDNNIDIFYSYSEADRYYNQWKGYFGYLYRNKNKENNLFKILDVRGD